MPKSLHVYVRIGARFSHRCCTLSTTDGGKIKWAETVRYLGVHIISTKAFACSLAHAKKSFYRALNAVFGKVAGVASEEVTVELLKVKCLPVLLYGLEACPISNKQFKSLDFVLNGCFRKIFRIRSAEVVQSCMLLFNRLSMYNAGDCCETQI